MSVLDTELFLLGMVLLLCSVREEVFDTYPGCGLLTAGT